MSDGKKASRGTPQGGVTSPLLANIYMHRFIEAFRKYGLDRRYGAVLVTYADDCARPKPLLLRDERSPHHKYPTSVSSLGPGATGRPVPSKQDRHNVLEGFSIPTTPAPIGAPKRKLASAQTVNPCGPTSARRDEAAANTN